LAADTEQAPDDDGDPRHLAVTRHANQAGAGSFDAGLL
jgi:hypothetical protein